MTEAPPRAIHYIDGQWIDEGETGTSVNPADGTEIGTYAKGSAELSDQAAVVARRAFEQGDWAMSPRQRAMALFEFADQLATVRDEMIALIVAENGKLTAEAVVEVDGSISEARYYGGLARNIFGRTTETGPGRISLLNREPAGVAGIIVPWNAPLTLLVRSLGPALAAGCTSVIKPAPQTPLIHALTMKCLANCEALPRGVINSVNENGSVVGETMVASDEIDVISFTGSSATGKKIMAGAAPTLKRLSLELGGKAPAIIFPDADLDAAVRELTRGSLVLAGQMCVAATRFLVHEQCYEEVRSRFEAAYGAVRVGPGNNLDSQMGALIDAANRDRVLELIEKCGQEGRLLVKGAPPTGAPATGNFVTPTLFEISDTRSPLVQEELFAPIVSLETFADEREAVHKANATRYGLAASLFTSDLNRAMHVSRALKSGTVWVNCHTRLFAESETGGYRQSGLGRLHGVEGLDDFLETKHVYMETGAL